MYARLGSFEHLLTTPLYQAYAKCSNTLMNKSEFLLRRVYSSARESNTLTDTVSLLRECNEDYMKSLWHMHDV
jgi:hypothetical protein